MHKQYIYTIYCIYIIYLTFFSDSTCVIWKMPISAKQYLVNTVNIKWAAEPDFSHKLGVDENKQKNPQVAENSQWEHRILLIYSFLSQTRKCKSKCQKSICFFVILLCLSGKSNKANFKVTMWYMYNVFSLFTLQDLHTCIQHWIQLQQWASHPEETGRGKKTRENRPKVQKCCPGHVYSIILAV